MFKLIVVCVTLGFIGCAAIRPNPEPTREPIPEPASRTPESCRPGYHLSSDRCCVEGAEWVPARELCVCLEPSGCEEPTPSEDAEPTPSADAENDAPAPPDEAPNAAPPALCPEGQSRSQRTAGRCCWTDQRWSPDDGACVGPPVCPPGHLIAGDECVPGSVPTWVDIAAGEFLMGSPADEEHRFADEQQHRVKLTRGFRIRATEVTQAEFQKVMGYNPSRFVQCGLACPVERVSWHEAAAFANALSVHHGLEPCYSCAGRPPQIECRPAKIFSAPSTCPGVRLPTEAEWEYAARAGIAGPRYGSELHRIAWFRGNSGGQTHRVATREPSLWGTFDMLGNVMEWCHDWYTSDNESSSVDPGGPGTGAIRALRGGSWLINDWRVRAAYRYRFDPSTRVSYLGFRVVRTRR